MVVKIISMFNFKWQLRFNKEKCEAMRITHSRDKSTANYTLGTALKDVKSFKDLGIIISKDLTYLTY